MTTPATAGGLTTEGTLALVVERLNDLREQQKADTAALTSAIESLRTEMQQQGQVYVPRQEWEQRNRLVDERHLSVTTELASRRVAWPAVAAVVLSAIAVAITVVNYIAS